MNLVSAALKRPITLMIIFFSLMIFAVMSLLKIPIDIFPQMNLPVVYVIEPYPGMSPEQMEGFFSTNMQDLFLYVDGIRTIESRNTQGLTFIRLTFYEGTDMPTAIAEITTYVSRAQKFFPPGALPPLVVRYDASSLPVGELVFSSKTENLDKIYDLATTRTRPMFALVPGLSAPPPMGANARSVVINADPEKMQAFNVSLDEMVQAIANSNVMAPSGNLRMGNLMYLTVDNSLERHVSQFANIPIKTYQDRTVLVGDVARVEDAADITVDYALINGKRSVFIPIVKTANASTWSVVQNLKKAIPEMQSLLPNDVQIKYEFDQSVFVINAVKSLASEGILGAVLTGIMVLLFLRDLRSSLVVIVTIPVSIMIGILFLSVANQTINIMTLSGLALAVGILVDQAVVTIENIHQHLEMGKEKRQAIYDACTEIAFPLFLILLCVLAVFVPSFMMKGVPRAMFLPLSLAIAFSMIASYAAAQTVVPILSNWILKGDKYAEKADEALDVLEEAQVKADETNEREHPEKNSFFERLKGRFTTLLDRFMHHKKITAVIYLVSMIILAGICFITIGKDMMPHINNGQFQMRLKAPEGTRLSRTTDMVERALGIIDSTVKGHVEITSAFVGPVSTNYATSNLYVFNPASNDAVIQVKLDEKYKINTDELKDALRHNMRELMPGVNITFEPIDMTDVVLSQGSTNSIEVRVAGRDVTEFREFTDSLKGRIEKIPFLRDVQVQQALDYPTIKFTIDRFKLSQFGLNINEVSNSITSATTSSRFIEKNFWLDSATAYTYQVQVQVPEYQMTSVEQLKGIPLIKGQNRPNLGDVADFKVTTTYTEYDRAGPRRYLTIGANIYKKDLAAATTAVQKAVKSMGEPPRGVTVEIKGMSSLLTETLDSLQNGLILAVLIILLMLAANYESIPVALTVVSTVPAVILGSLLALFATGSDINLQSYMGIIMSVGVSVANAILIVTNAERLRLETRDAAKAAVMAAGIRLRPILMTSLAMIVGMIPMASGLSEAGAQSAPLGRAVIGGLLASTFAALLVLPQIYAWVRQKASLESPSLMPVKL